MTASFSPFSASRGFFRRALACCLLGLSAAGPFSGSTAHAQYADWNANPPKILPNERVGAGAVYDSGSGRQFRNVGAFAALKADGSITVWGASTYGGSGAPTGKNFTAVHSNSGAFAALKEDGSITAWGDSTFGGSGAPVGSGFTMVYSTARAFAALNADSSITAWGSASYGGTGTPTGQGFTSVYSNFGAFAALKADGSITAWGNEYDGGSGAPTGKNFTAVYSTNGAFAALNADGSITAWGRASYGGTGAPTGQGFAAVYSTSSAFAALKVDGSIIAWGSSSSGGSGAPTDKNFTALYSTSHAFTALKDDGSVSSWGDSSFGGGGAPADTDFTSVYATAGAFAALKDDGSIIAWGASTQGGSNAPTDTGFITVYSGNYAFAALKADGSLSAWGNSFYGGSGAPAGAGFTAVYSSGKAFAALKADGSITAWGDASYGGSGAPSGTGFTSVQSVSFVEPLELGAAVTASLVSLDSTTAFLQGEVVREGYSTVTERGFVYALATVTDPAIGDAGVAQVADNGSGSGAFSTTLSGLTPDTAYVLKSYAINSVATTYSAAVNFSTNLPPVIASDGGDANVAVSVAENSSAVTTVSATDADAGQAITYSITGGADAARFAIGSSTGALTFTAAPNFELPSDADTDNVYQVIVSATDDGNPPKSTTQTLTVTVTNVADSGGIVIEQPVDSNLAPGATVAFGSATVGQAIDRVFTVRSSGEVPLQLGNAAFSGTNAGEFSVVGGLQSNITAGGSATFTVRFRPSSSGARSAMLSLPNNDQSPGKSPFTLNLSGTGSTTQVLANYTTPGSQVLGGWVSDGNFTIGQVGTTSPGNNWPSAEGPDKAVDNNTSSKFLHFRNNNAGLILRPTNSSVIFNRLQLFTANDAPERDPASYIIYGSASALGGSAGTNIAISGLTKIAEGTVTMRDARSSGPTIIQFANSSAYTSYVVVFPTVKNSATSTLTQISEVQLAQGIDPPFAVAMEHARGGQLAGSTFSFGTIGSSNPGTNWLAGESPDHALDGNINSKFAILRSTGAGLISSPQAGPAKLTSLTFWTANDAPERDPVSYQIYGFPTRVTQTSGTLDVGTAGTLLGSGSLELPAARISGPVTVGFTNGTAYASYLVVFPAVKNSPSTSLTQIAEVQFGNAPYLALSPAEAFTANFGSPSAAQTLSLTGTALIGEAVLTASAGYEISSDGSTFASSLTLTPTDEEISATVHVRMSDAHTQVGPLTGSLRMETLGGYPRTIALSGTVLPAMKPAVPALAGFVAGYASASASQTVEINGGGLDSLVLVTAPAGFEVSTDGINFSPFVRLGQRPGAIQSVYRGDFTTAAGNIWRVGSGKEYPNEYAFAAITSNGSVVSWGSSDWGGDSSSVAWKLASNVKELYSNEVAFAALKGDGSVVTWGYGPFGGDSSSVAGSLSSNVTAVFSASYAFAALKSDGSVVTWGDPGWGGDSSSVAGKLTSNVTALFSASYAFAALKSDGSVVTWGQVANGGDSSGVAAKLTSNVTALYSNGIAFAALKSDGSVVTWGNYSYGGDSSSVAASLSSGVTAVFSNYGAFAALKSDGSVVTWGGSGWGGNSSSVAGKLASNVTAVFSTETAFAALKADGSVVTWGDSSSGGDSSSVAGKLASNVTAVYATGYAFAALKTDGSVVTWGNADSGADSSSVSGKLTSNVTTMFSTAYAFAALKVDGSVVTWGDVNAGGNSSSVAGNLSSNVKAVYSTPTAFAAVKNDGSVVTWGDADAGGTGGPANIGVEIPPSFPFTVHVRLTPTGPAGPVSGEMTLTSSGIATQTIALSGTVVQLSLATVTVAEDSATYSYAGFVSGMTPGVGDDGQSVTLAVTNDNNALFSAQPVISADGTLTFTPAANAHGMATVTVIATDSTGLSSAPLYFTVRVTSVIDAPVLAAPTFSNVSAYSATMQGEILNADVADYDGKAIIYAPTAANSTLNYYVAGAVTIPLSGPSFSTTRSNLLASGTSYSVRSCAYGPAGMIYSEVSTFNTLPGAPVMLDNTAGLSTSVTNLIGNEISTTQSIGYSFATGSQSVNLSTVTLGITSSGASAIRLRLFERGPDSLPVGDPLWVHEEQPRDFGSNGVYATIPLSDLLLSANHSYTIMVDATSGSAVWRRFGSSRPLESTAGWTASAVVFNNFAGVNTHGTDAYPFVIQMTGESLDAPTTPSAPTSLVATAGDGQVSLAFTAGADAGSAITNYEFSTDSGTSWSAFNPAVTTSPVVITGLTNGTAYSLLLRAVNASGPGAASNAVSATALASPAPPSFAGYAVTAKQGKTLALSLAKVLARATDPDGGAVTLTQVFGPSAQGGTVSLTGTLNYTPAASFTGTDSFDIELTGSQGGILRTTVTVTVTGSTAAGSNQAELRLRDGMVDLTFRGIPGRAYTIQRSADLLTWATLATVTAAADGKITFTDPSPPQPSGYYRTQN